MLVKTQVPAPLSDLYIRIGMGREGRNLYFTEMCLGDEHCPVRVRLVALERAQLFGN